MGPIVLAAQLFEVLAEKSTHLNNTIGHTLDLTEPLLLQLGVVEDGRGDTSAVDWRVGVERTDENLDLRVDTGLLLCRLANNGESTSTLTVQTLQFD